MLDLEYKTDCHTDCHTDFQFVDSISESGKGKKDDRP